MDVHYLRTSCIALQGEKRDNTTIRCFSCWEKWRATLNLATLRPHAKNKKTNMKKQTKKSRYKQRCLYARDTEVLIVDVGFWSKPKIFFLLLTAIYIMYSVGVRDIKGILYINSKLTTNERLEIKQGGNDFERDCGSNW